LDRYRWREGVDVDVNVCASSIYTSHPTIHPSQNNHFIASHFKVKNPRRMKDEGKEKKQPT
jgi:hypothetical protein